MPLPSRIYYGSTLIYDDQVLRFPRFVEYGSANTTSGGTAHTVGSWVELIASTDAASDLLFVEFSSNANGIDTSSLVDIGTGAAGSESVVVASIPAGFSGATLSTKVALPVGIASGTRIAARSRSVRTSATVSVFLSAMSTGRSSPTTLDVIGATTATSRGTNITPVNTWVQLTASTSQAYQALVMVPNASTAGMNADAGIRFDLGTGAAGAETRVAEVLCEANASEQFGLDDGVLPLVHDVTIPAGTRLSVRCNTNRAYFDAVIFGVPV